MRNWLDMSREEFDVDAAAPTLFDAPVTAAAPAEDGCGTGDLLAHLDDEDAAQ